jgi:hypothetical protein
LNRFPKYLREEILRDKNMQVLSRTQLFRKEYFSEGFREQLALRM